MRDDGVAAPPVRVWAPAFAGARGSHARFPPIAASLDWGHPRAMRLPSRNHIRRSIGVALKAFAITVAILALAVFTPIWNWSGYPRPSIETFIATLITLFVALMPGFILCALLETSPDDRPS